MGEGAESVAEWRLEMVLSVMEGLMGALLRLSGPFPSLRGGAGTTVLVHHAADNGIFHNITRLACEGLTDHADCICGEVEEESVRMDAVDSHIKLLWNA